MRTSLIGVITVMLAMLACGGNSASADMAGAAPSKGDKIYNTQCTLCHGKDGGLGISGAKDLRQSTLTREEMLALVSNGKGAMAPYKNVLTKAEISAVVDHVLGLRKKE